MKIAVIKSLVKSYTISELEEAEGAILNEEEPQVEVEGDDEGEQLTHVIGALEIKRNMESGMKENEALRGFTQRVRNSIS